MRVIVQRPIQHMPLELEQSTNSQHVLIAEDSHAHACMD